MTVVRQIRRGRRHVGSEQIDRQVVGEMCRVDHRHRHRAVGVHVRADVHLFHAALGVDPDRARPGETEVRGKSPEAGGNEIFVVLQSDQGVVAGGVLSAPPMSVSRCVAVDEGIVHVQCPLETFTTEIKGGKVLATHGPILIKQEMKQR